jgi:hypothetical protein
MEAATEHRRHRRLRVLSAVIVTPNGHGHDTHILDISEGGACVALPSDWVPVDDAPLKILFLPDTDTPVVLQAHVKRVALDHLGVAFDDAQTDGVRQLLEGLGTPP